MGSVGYTYNTPFATPACRPVPPLGCPSFPYTIRHAIILFSLSHSFSTPRSSMLLFLHNLVRVGPAHSPCYKNCRRTPLGSGLLADVGWHEGGNATSLPAFSSFLHTSSSSSTSLLCFSSLSFPFLSLSFPTWST